MIRRNVRKPSKERAIAFNSLMGAMVYNGVKTETRRPTGFFPSPAFPYPRPEKKGSWKWGFYEKKKGGASIPERGLWCPYAGPGQILWVREPYWIRKDDRPIDQRHKGFLAYHGDLIAGDSPGEAGQIMRPSMMPRIWSRSTLEVVEVRLEPLHEITDEGAEAEGFRGGVKYFREQWEKIYDKDPKAAWEANPWAWVIRFNLLVKGSPTP